MLKIRFNGDDFLSRTQQTDLFLLTHVKILCGRILRQGCLPSNIFTPAHAALRPRQHDEDSYYLNGRSNVVSHFARILLITLDIQGWIGFRIFQAVDIQRKCDFSMPVCVILICFQDDMVILICL